MEADTNWRKSNNEIRVDALRALIDKTELI